MDSTSVMWLVLYFFFNLSLTIYNKVVMQFCDFRMPWALTSIHALCGLFGCLIAARLKYFHYAYLDTRSQLVMLAFSVLYTLNIALSNVSLDMVTVPFHQVVRATSPVFVIVINYLWLNKQCSRRMALSMLPIVLGVGLATFGDYYATRLGIILTVVGSVLAAVKTVATSQIQRGKLKLHPLDLLARMCPLAFGQMLVYMYFSGEYEKLYEYYQTKLTPFTFSLLLLNGILAFGLNVVSFTANKKVGPLTISVAANVKQVLTVLLSVVIFSLKITYTNALGILVTLFGGAYYSYVDFMEKNKRPGQKQPTFSKIETADLPKPKSSKQYLPLHTQHSS